jgi:5-methylcytosine-specific restriction endonuclease McrA
MRAYADRVQAATGVHPTTLQRRRFKEENGYWPQMTGSAWIDPRIRQTLYERDGWSCAICELPVDREAHWNDDFAPSLDHIKPRSLGGTHDAENLRTAHRICNSVRGAEYELA